MGIFSISLGRFVSTCSHLTMAAGPFPFSFLIAFATSFVLSNRVVDNDLF
jgi:hypothetical protein